MNNSILQEVKSYISFENGKWKYIDEGGLINLYRFGQFHSLASKSEICMFHKILELEKSEKVEYNCDDERIK